MIKLTNLFAFSLVLFAANGAQAAALEKTDWNYIDASPSNVTEIKLSNGTAIRDFVAAEPGLFLTARVVDGSLIITPKPEAVGHMTELFATIATPDAATPFAGPAHLHIRVDILKKTTHSVWVLPPPKD